MPLPLRSIGLILGLLLLLGTCTNAKKKESDVGEQTAQDEVVGHTMGQVIVLTDANFESLTQATSGSTTGEWFIDFYAPWCGHCKKLEGTWADLAKELSERIPVAKVDATANPNLRRRFGITAFPTLIFLKDGQQYKYSGQRTVEALKTFALGGWKNVSPTTIPPPSSAWEGILSTLEGLTTAQKIGLALAGALAGMITFGIILLLCLPRDTPKKKKAPTPTSASPTPTTAAPTSTAKSGGKKQD